MEDFRDIPFAFTSVEFYNDPAQGLAYCNRRTGVVHINLAHWYKLPEEHRFWVLAHEEGHIVEQTRDEIEADGFASRKYLAADLPPSESIRALTANLDDTNPVHVARAYLQLQRALQFDFLHNHNERAYRSRYASDASIKQQLHMYGTIPPALMEAYDRQSGDESHFLGLAIAGAARLLGGKKAKARRNERREARVANRKERRAAKNDRRRAKTENIRSKAASRQTLADQGIVQPSDFASGLGSVASLASSILGGGGQGAPIGNDNPVNLGAMQQAAQDVDNSGDGGYQDAGGGDYTDPNPGPKPPKKNNTTMIIVIVVAVLLLIVGLIFATRKSR